MPGAEEYYQPYVKPGEDIATPGDADGGPMSAWGDLLERMTREQAELADAAPDVPQIIRPPTT